MSDYVKMKDLVGERFSITGYNGYKWKMWISEEGRMHVSDTYVEGHKKGHQLETSRGLLDVSSAQLGQMLEGSLDRDGKANLIGQTFEVRSNGKSGMDIRYYINPVKSEPKPETETAKEVEAELDSPVDLSDIPF